MRKGCTFPEPRLSPVDMVVKERAKYQQTNQHPLSQSDTNQQPTIECNVSKMQIIDYNSHLPYSKLKS